MYYVTPRQLVFPGDLVATIDSKIEGPVYLDNGRYRSSVVGLVEFRDDTVVIVALEGVYRAKKGDLVVGYITDVLATGWEIDVQSFLPAYLPVSEALHKYVELESTPLAMFLNVGDVVVAKVKDVDMTDEYPIILTLKEERVGKVESGSVIEISPAKIPRVIGKKGTMLNTLMEVGCDIVVGQNGRVLIRCRNPRDEVFLASLIKKIEAESHVMGLTDRIRAEIEKYKKLKP
ncbi:MAG: exosome complex RNA-binding protein Rrp4 [Pyrobaculum sp.]